MKQIVKAWLFLLPAMCSVNVFSASFEAGVGFGRTALQINGNTLNGNIGELLFGKKINAPKGMKDAAFGLRIGQIQWDQKDMESYLYSLNTSSTNPSNMLTALYLGGTIEPKSGILLGLTPYVLGSIGFCNGNVINILFISVMAGVNFDIKPVSVSVGVDATFALFDYLVSLNKNNVFLTPNIKIRIPI